MFFRYKKTALGGLINYAVFKITTRMIFIVYAVKMNNY